MGTARSATECLFIGVYPAGLVYADRCLEVDGDYERLAFLPYDTLNPWYAPNIPSDLRARIQSDVQDMQARRGQDYRVTTCGQTVRLGTVTP